MRTTLELSPAIQQASASRDYLSPLFAARPRLTAVAQSLLQEWIKDWAMGNSLQASDLWVGVQREGAGPGFSQLQTLSDALIRRCMIREPLNYTPGHHRLLASSTTSGPVSTTGTEAVSIDDIELMLNTLAPELGKAFTSHLVAYWNSAVPANASLTRWRAVSNHLHLGLQRARQNPPLNALEREMLLGDEAYVTRQANRTGTTWDNNGLRFYQVYAASEGQPGQWPPLLVLRRQVNQQEVVLVYIPPIQLLRLDQLADVGALLPRYMSEYTPGLSIQWVLKEIDSNPFDYLAQSLLEKQLRDLARIDWSQYAEIADYEQLFKDLTDPLAWFDPDRNTPLINEEQLPLWLQTASTADRLTYGQLLSRLTQVQQRTAGAGFMDGLDPIDVYARKALQRQMALDYPQEVLINPDDYRLTFTRTQGGTVGWTQQTVLTLTQSALENPFATPYAGVEISNQAEPGYVPDWWIKPTYLKKLIETVNVGRHYPALLKDRLILNAVESGRRRRLFIDQMTVQLPLQALEYCLSKRQGVTFSGFQVVRALLADEPAQRQVDGEAIVARPLAFLTYEGSAAHRAGNMFVIGPRDNSTLPHILYRPGHTEALRQFPSREALLQAIAQGDSTLQGAVLESFSEQDRALFRNGGFMQPHTQRFLQGDEHEPLYTPSPVLLSDTPVSGDFLASVFDENARSLWQRAEKQSTSNEALRWTLFKNDLWQVFGAFLPLIRGPVATAGWLYTLLSSLHTYVRLPQEADPTARADALAELLSSMSALLLNHALTLDERLAVNPAKMPIRPRLIESDFSPPVHQKKTPSTFAWRRLHADITEMNLSWSDPSGQPTGRLKTALETFKWRPAAGEQSPDILKNVERTGPLRGLVSRPVTGAEPHHLAVLQGALYAVKKFEGCLRVVDLKQPGRWGPWIRRNNRGVWTIDLQMRLRGAGPKKTVAARRAQIQHYNQELQNKYHDVTARLMTAERAVQIASTLNENPALSMQQRPAIRASLVSKLEEQMRFQFEKLDLLYAKNHNQPLPGFEQELIQQQEALVDNLQHQMAVVIQERHDAAPPKAVQNQWLAQLDETDESTAQAAHKNIQDYLGKVAGFNDRLIELSTLEKNNLQQLMSVPGFDLSRSTLAQDPVQAAPLDWMFAQLDVYKSLVLRRPPLPEEFDDFVHLKQLCDSVMLAIASQKYVQAPGLVSPELRISGLEKLIHEYTDTQSWLIYYKQAQSGLIDPEHLMGLWRQIDKVRQMAEQDLALAISEQSHIPERQPTPTPSLSPGKRVIRDRKQRVWVGQERERTPELDVEIMDVIGPVDNQPVISFRKNATTEEWEENIEPKKPSFRPARSLKKLLADARDLLSKGPSTISREQKESLKSKTPNSTEAHLARLADAMDEVAGKIRDIWAQEPARKKAADEQLVDKLTQGATGLREQGRLLRVAIIERNLPNEAGIEYLKAQGEIDISLIEGRVKLKSENDYLQEYVIHKKNRQVLAYAHFHYSAADTANPQFNVAHLKLPEQRYLSFASLAVQPKENILPIYYSRISPRLAEPLFLSVTRSIKRHGRKDYW
ncbi:dermonecrotic toxin domain-containing protein [Pseudomonas sp. R3-18-08]|uniref:dermonecrotic toxin domain-containing protein n=1 Tax=Pseudomonas sp. R3-18-08 TaxID=1173283 RepID=UPI000F58EE02|nr:DUF6543 domain-containing protein [Pseudomonas sp. R3-18-08]AZF17751.1 hypothetical protein C4J92_4297 [Pseudomonas sp. R3-18-08]